MKTPSAAKENIDVNNDPRMPYQLPFPVDAQSEIVIPSPVPDDERVWVPQMENVWFRPLCLNASQGYWVNLLRVRRAGILSRHRHPAPGPCAGLAIAAAQ